MRYSSCVALITALALATACKPTAAPGTAAVAVAAVTLNQSPASLVAGATFQFVATVKDASGNSLTDRTVSWTTSAATVATVSSNGLLTAVSTGTAQISATSEGVTASATVLVTAPAGGGTNAPVATVTVTAPGTNVLTGATLQAAAVLKDAQGNALTNRTVAWSVIPSANGTISSTGLFTAVVEGAVTIRATSEGVAGNLAVTVNAPGLFFKEIRLGGAAYCGITSDDKGYCWGFNDEGSVGDGTKTQRLFPVLISGGFLWKTLVPAVGDEGELTCGLTTAGLAKCWGDFNTNGFPYSSVPATVNGDHVFASLVTGDDNACGILTNTETWCFGEDGFGELGSGVSGFYTTTPVKVTGNHVFTKLSMGGQEHYCGITAQGDAWCWGFGQEGALGNGEFLDSAVPVKVIGGHNFTDITASDYRVCALDVAGKPWCWGFNTGGVLGDGTTINQAQPVAVVGNHLFTQISGGRSNVCGLTANGEVWCWGENSYGWLGNGTTNASAVPVKATTSVAFSSIFVAAAGSCGLTPAGAAYCWGGEFGLVPTRFTGH